MEGKLFAIQSFKGEEEKLKLFAIRRWCSRDRQLDMDGLGGCGYEVLSKFDDFSSTMQPLH